MTRGLYPANRSSFGTLAVMALVLSSLAAACGGGSSEESSGYGASTPASGTAAANAPIDPCALVTKGEAEAALGGAVGEAERPKEANFVPRMVTCRYVANKEPAVAVMTVMVNRGETASQMKTGFNSAKAQFAAAETVSGLGEDAFYIAEQLHVLKGAIHLTIGGDFDLNTAKGLAAKALERLPA